MSLSQRYAVQQPSIGNLLTYIETGEIAIPEIQRPFVWDATKVRNLMDSLYQGFPVGFLIAWQNPDVRLKDGTSAKGKKILIDGQQRVTALMAALLGREVVNRNYRQIHIRIAFHPVHQRFEVHNPAIAKDASWLPDISIVFDPATKLHKLTQQYCDQNPGVDEDVVYENIGNLKSVVGNQIGLIELAHDLDIETVTEIFIRVNSAGVPLSQADFAMSKIAVNDTYGGNMLRKAIDYFSRLAVAPEFHSTLKNDSDFAQTDYFQRMSWLRNEVDSLYDPSYTDMLRVAFTTEFRRGRLQDLVALLSGRNFETRAFEESVVEDSFNRLRSGVLRFMGEDNFKKYMLIIRSAGFVEPSLIRSQNALNFGYILYLTMRDIGTPANDIERLVRRWFVMSLLTGRTSGSFESQFETDVRQIRERGPQAYSDLIMSSVLSDAFWSVTLPESLNSSSANNQAFRVFQAAQVKLGDRGFLSNDLTVRDLLSVKSDVHHIFPKDFLKRHGLAQSQYNQVANYVVTQSEINIAISNREPSHYFGEVAEQVSGGDRKYGNITSREELQENFKMNCIPENISAMSLEDYPGFLEQRRRLMSERIRLYFDGL